MIKLINLLKEQVKLKAIAPPSKDKSYKQFMPSEDPESYEKFKPEFDVDNDDVIFVGGLDTEPKYKSLSTQTSILKSGLSAHNVISISHTNALTALPMIKKYPNATVVLFSAGCRAASSIAAAMQDKTKLYIVEPYAISASTRNSVRTAVDSGVPANNVFVGSTRGRGAGIVAGATEMPTIKGGVMASHWNALAMVGKYI
jgi:hypothetical protein